MKRLDERLFLSPPHMGGTEKDYVDKAFASNYIAPLGPMVVEFEKRLNAYLETPCCGVFSSGTASIHLALMVLGVKAGDVVICSSFTFCGTVNPVLYVGAEPVFVDSEPDSWNMSPELLEEAIQSCRKNGKHVAAILPVHLYGMPAKIDRIMEIARHYEIPVIEDAAEALGSEYKQQKLGAWGDVGILSFNGNKIITSSGGGALLASDEALIKKALFLATQAREPKPYYEHETIGYNYRMSNIVAAIGCGQMEFLEQRVARRRQIHDIYEECFKDVEGISIFNEYSAEAKSNFWLSTILLSPELFPEPEVVRQKLEEYNIESRALWKPLHVQPVFKRMGCQYFGGAFSEKLFEIGLCLPSGTAADDQLLCDVAELIIACKKH